MTDDPNEKKEDGLVAIMVDLCVMELPRVLSTDVARRL